MAKGLIFDDPKVVVLRAVIRELSSLGVELEDGDVAAVDESKEGLRVRLELTNFPGFVIVSNYHEVEDGFVSDTGMWWRVEDGTRHLWVRDFVEAVRHIRGVEAERGERD
jgi:hypothetical protein